MKLVWGSHVLWVEVGLPTHLNTDGHIPLGLWSLQNTTPCFILLIKLYLRKIKYKQTVQRHIFMFDH
jgi:hypothetical protein